MSRRPFSLLGPPVERQACIAKSGVPGHPPRFAQAFEELGDAFAYAGKERIEGEITTVEGYGKSYLYLDNPTRKRGEPAPPSNWRLAK